MGGILLNIFGRRGKCLSVKMTPWSSSSRVGWARRLHLAQQIFGQDVGLYEERSAQPTELISELLMS